MKKHFLSNLRLLWFLAIICTFSLVPENAKAQEYTTKIENIDVFEPADKFSSDIENVRVAKMTLSSEVNVIPNDSIQEERKLPPPIVYEQLGFVTEDLESAFPDVVITNKNGDKSINYNALIAVMFKIIQEQEARIKKLEQQTNSVKQ